MTLAELASICHDNGLALDEGQQSLLAQYAHMLAEWNAKINLISRKDEENILERHILHSLTLAMPDVCHYDFRDKRAIDVGTGGGLPGIPLKIALPTADITLLDSIQKKIVACNDMIVSLGLRGIRATVGRSEDVAKMSEHAHAYDAVVSRAVAPLDDLVKWTRGLLKPGAVLFALKGGDLAEEIALAGKMKGVKSIDVQPLELKGYSGFLSEGKKLVRVNFSG